VTPALVVTSHGTSSPDGRAAVARLVAAVRRRLGHVEVVDAFVDVQHPRLDVALEAVTGPAVVVPLLLAPGFHVHVDIARTVAGRDAVAAGVLGPDRALTDILVGRLTDVGLRDDDAIVLGVAGSSDARARRSLDRAATRLAMKLGREVRVGHLGGTGRPVREVVAEARESARHVVVANYLLAPGHFADLLAGCGADAVAAPFLDDRPPDDRLVQLVIDRYEQVASGWCLRWAS
jgi:sirohydrochlorin ferrochelatase